MNVSALARIMDRKNVSKKSERHSFPAMVHTQARAAKRAFSSIPSHLIRLISWTSPGTRSETRTTLRCTTPPSLIRSGLLLDGRHLPHMFVCARARVLSEGVCVWVGGWGETVQ